MLRDFFWGYQDIGRDKLQERPVAITQLMKDKNMDIQELRENFSYLTDWEDKYRYLIELGDMLPPFPEEAKTAENKVEGCMSQVWFLHTMQGNKHCFSATSDAHIVRGLEAVLLILINDKTTEEIKAVNIEAVFDELELSDNLSPTRRNGFYAMVERVHQLIG